MSNQKLKIQIGTKQAKEGTYVEVIKNGPYIIHGEPKIVQQFIIADANGASVKYQEGQKFPSSEGTALCRCGLSKNKPFCDGSHQKANEHDIDLSDTASMEPSLKTAEVIEGPEIALTDDQKLCAFSRFCENGNRIWEEVKSDKKESNELAKEMAHHCPAGRLIVWNKDNNQPIEDENVEPVIGLIEDQPKDLSGPIALWGGIPVKSSEGEFYEVRNRQTLCRCGLSCNKPFCDGTHGSFNIQDDLPKTPDADGKVF